MMKSTGNWFVRTLGACAFLFTSMGAAPALGGELAVTVPMDIQAELHPLERAPLRAARDEVYLAQVAHKEAQAMVARHEGLLDAAQGNLERLIGEGAHAADIRIARGYVSSEKERLEAALLEKSRLEAAVHVREAELELAWVQLLKMKNTPTSAELSSYPFEAQLSRAEITFDRLTRKAERMQRRTPLEMGVASR